MASLALTAFGMGILIFQMTSCTKTEAQSTTKTDTIYKCTNLTIKGLWEGAYLTNQVSHVPTYAAFTFYSNGSLLFKANGVPPAQSVIYSRGKWTRTNDVITFIDTTINYSSIVIQSGSFKYDSIQNTLSNGVWQNVTSDNGQYYTGTFPTMTKIQ